MVARAHDLEVAAGDARCRSGPGDAPVVHLEHPLEVEPLEGLDGPLIVRWMLHPGRVYDEARAAYAPFDRLREEDPAARESVADLAAAHVARGHEVYVTINNKAEGSAPLSVLRLAERLVERLAARPGGPLHS